MSERDPVDAEADLPCPVCGRRLRVALGVARRGGTVVCPGGHPVDLRAGRGGVPEVDRFLGDLLRAIARIDAPRNAPSPGGRGHGSPR